MGVQIQAEAAQSHKKIYQHLYVQVLCAIAIGVLLGHFYPSLGAQLKPLGDMFIQAIKMVIAPIIFCTVVHGVASERHKSTVGSAYPGSGRSAPLGTDSVAPMAVIACRRDRS